VRDRESLGECSLSGCGCQGRSRWCTVSE